MGNKQATQDIDEHGGDNDQETIRIDSFLMMVGGSSSGKTQTILNIRKDFNIAIRIYQIMDMLLWQLKVVTDESMQLPMYLIPKFCKMKRNWKKERKVYLQRLDEKFRKKLELYDVSIDSLVEVVGKSIGKDKHLSPLMDKQIFKRLTKSDFDILEKCKIILKTFYIFETCNFPFRVVNEQNVGLVLVSTNIFKLPQAITNLKALKIFETVLIYVSLTGFLDNTDIRNHIGYSNELDRTIESLIENVVQFPDKRFEFVFTKPDLLEMVLSKGVEYPIRILHSTRNEFCSIPSFAKTLKWREYSLVQQVTISNSLLHPLSNFILHHSNRIES